MTEFSGLIPQVKITLKYTSDGCNLFEYEVDRILYTAKL